ncbi:TPA: hypothetical protein DCR49_05935 [Candidatus Delongbacteria bacterium]|nr:hypothetical protein [Candidatus Delongbacteria bacterium]
MKNLPVVLLCFFTVLYSAISQEELVRIENNGYYSDIKVSEYGIIATNNLDNALYLINNGTVQTLLENPGCGRYFTLYRDNIGFKLIDPETGLQSPAVLNINSGKVTELFRRSRNCGQVSFSNNGRTAFTVEEYLYIIYPDNSTKTFSIGTYSNLSPISPDGNFVCFHDEKQNLFIIDLNSGITKQTTENGEFINQKWSPDSKKIAYQSLSGKLSVYDTSYSSIEDFSHVRDFSWASGTSILMTKTTHDEQNLISSEIYELNVESRYEISLTATKDIYERSPVSFNGRLYFEDLGTNSIISADFSDKLSDTLIEFNGTNDLRMKPVKINRDLSKDMLVVPYINQVYSTDSYVHRYGCCAATTCAMVLAYYKIIPHWKSSNNNWAHVIYDWYYYNNFAFSIPYPTGGTGGGDGYMWNDNGNGGSSPSTNQKYYLQLHRLASSQYWSNWWTVISNDITNGNPHPMCVMITESGHLILPIGIADASQQLMYYNDPYGNKNIAYPSTDGAGVLYDWPGFNTGHASLVAVAWTTSAVGNKPSAPDEDVNDLQLAYGTDYSDFDNNNNGFWMSADGTTGMKYWRNIDDGSNSYWWTGAMTATTIDDYSACWNPDITVAGNYKVEAFIPVNTEVVTNAKYQIRHNSLVDVVRVDQSANGGTWVNLGTYYFTGTDNEFIYLGDATGSKEIKLSHEENEKITYKILYDKIRFTIQVPGFTSGGDWEYGTDSVTGSVSGGNIWGTVMNANHTDNTNSSLLYDVPGTSLSANSILTFDHWYIAESSGTGTTAYDGGNVKISSNGGSFWEILYPLPDYSHTISTAYANPMPGEPAYSGNSGGWVRAAFDLSTFAGSDVIIKWQFGSDAIYNYRGWYLDNISVSVMPEPENVQTTSAGSTISITWDAVPDATEYIIYASDLPDGVFTPLDTSAINSWTGNSDAQKKFYKVSAVLQYDK